MSQFLVNMLFVAGSFAVYTYIAVWARAKSTREFYIAGGEVHPVFNGMATAADWLSAASFISVAGLISVGYVNSSFILGWTGGYVLLATLLAPYLRRFGKYTVPDFVGSRYDSRAARLVAVVCLIIISLTYVIGQMTGAGVAFARFLEVSSTTGLIISAIVVFFYAVLGGMKGVTYTQVAQYIVLILAFTVPAIYLSLQMTGHFLPQVGFVGNFIEPSGSATTPLLHKLNEVVRDLGFQDYTADVENKWNMFLFTLTLMVGTAGLPHVIIRFFTVPKISDARWSAGWALVFIALFYTTAPPLAGMARLNLLESIYPGEGIEEAIVYDERPEWFEKWETTGLLTFEDKNNDGRVQYYNDKNEEYAATVAAERGWAGNELTINNDILVLALPEIGNMPSWIIGLMAAGGIAAALSTASGLLLAISSAVSHDLIKNTLFPNISDKAEMLAARISMVGAILIATWLGINPPGFAAQTVALAFGIAASSIFPTLMMGIFVKRINAKGAVAGMSLGAIFTISYIFMYLGWFFIPGTNNFPNTPEFWIFGISPLSVGCIGALINFAVAISVSYATEQPSEEIQRMVESVRYP